MKYPVFGQISLQVALGSSNQLVMPIFLDVGQYHDLMSGDVIGLYIMSKPTLNHMLHVRFFTLYTIFVTEDKNRAPCTTPDLDGPKIMHDRTVRISQKDFCHDFEPWSGRSTCTR